MVEKWPDDIPLEKALYQMNALKAIVEAIQEAEGGEGTDHDEFMAQPKAEDAAPHTEHGIRGR
jgi:hypothetical protein